MFARTYIPEIHEQLVSLRTDVLACLHQALKERSMEAGCASSELGMVIEELREVATALDAVLGLGDL